MNRLGPEKVGRTENSIIKEIKNLLRLKKVHKEIDDTAIKNYKKSF